MVYKPRFPAALTKEELMLLDKYEKLKKMKEALQALKSPKEEPEKPITMKSPTDAHERKKKKMALQALKSPKQEPEKPITMKRPTDAHERKKKKMALQALKSPKEEPEKPITMKRPTDAHDAREVARQLIKSGAIPPIQKQQTKQDQTTFKRPNGQKRKRSVAESTQNDVAQETIKSEIVKKKPRLYDKKPLHPLHPKKSRTGNTIFVAGNKVSEEFLKKTFNDFGTIVNVSMEIEKGRGFVTFAKPESADRAIAEMHSKSVNGIKLLVELARHQPQIVPINDATSSAVWSFIAASKSQKGSHNNRREMMQYDEDFLL